MGVGTGDKLLLMTPSRSYSLGRILGVERGTHVREKGAKGCGLMKSLLISAINQYPF